MGVRRRGGLGSDRVRWGYAGGGLGSDRVLDLWQTWALAGGDGQVFLGGSAGYRGVGAPEGRNKPRSRVWL